MNLYKKILIATFIVSGTLILGKAPCDNECNDIIVEFKGAYFRPTAGVTRHIYKEGAIFGPEVTFRILQGIYGFLSLDYFPKKGHSIGLHSPTHLNLLSIGAGLKGMFQLCNWATVYLGLGFAPTYLHTKDLSPFVIKNRTKWGFGGVVKGGAYIDLPYDFVLDLFVDYSFVKVPRSHSPDTSIGYIEQRRADVSGVIVGGGIGYRFN